MKEHKCKKPSVKGMAHMGYLGHFAQDKFIQKGHNETSSRVGDFFSRHGRVGKAATGEEETADEKFRRNQRVLDEEARERQNNDRR